MANLVAIPLFGDEVAPCFEAAGSFALARVRNTSLESVRLLASTGCEGLGRVQMMRDSRISILICNGIKSLYRDLLETGGVAVVSNVACSASDALLRLMRGELSTEQVGRNLRHTVTKTSMKRESIFHREQYMWHSLPFTRHYAFICCSYRHGSYK